MLLTFNILYTQINKIIYFLIYIITDYTEDIEDNVDIKVIVDIKDNVDLKVIVDIKDIEDIEDIEDTIDDTLCLLQSLHFNNSQWRQLFYHKFNYLIDIDKCIHINWNYINNNELTYYYYMSIYSKLYYSVKDIINKMKKLVSLNTFQLNLKFTDVSNIDLLLIDKADEYNKEI